MAKLKTESEKILNALEKLHTGLEDIFVLEASRAGIGGHKIRAILGIEMARVTRITKHVKKGD
jgi:hypothetical protein